MKQNCKIHSETPCKCHIEDASPSGMPGYTLITQVSDVTKLQGMVTDLWCLLDDIDTLDDACRSNDSAFRVIVRDVQQKRHKILTSDGYNLHLP